MVDTPSQYLKQGWTAPTFDYEGAAQQLGQSKSWLQKQVAANAVPHRRLGRSVRFTAADLQEILQMSYRPPAAPTRRRSRPGAP
jgi:excisionase family DNA binding protein